MQQDNGRFLGILAILMLHMPCLASGTRAAVCPISSALHVTHLLGIPVGLWKDYTHKVLHNMAAGIWWALDLTWDLNPGLCCILNFGRINPFLCSVKISNLPLFLVGIGSGVQVGVTPKQVNCDFTLAFSSLFCFLSLNYIAQVKYVAFNKHLLLLTDYVQGTASLSRTIKE